MHERKQERPFDPFLPPLNDEEAEAAGLPDDAETPTADRAGRLERRAIRIPLLVVGVLALIGAFGVATGRIAFSAAPSEAAPSEENLPVLTFDLAEPFTFSGLDIHPDRMFADHFGGAFLTGPGADSIASADRDFRYRLDMYQKAYGEDDNFTIRVLDERSGETLEVFTLRDLKAQYQATGEVNWNDVDFPARRAATRQLIDKWAARGVPRSAITIRWGRADQVAEARDRDAPFIQYEIQLARRLGLSLLATEIGTVETFNQDWLVSPVGAESRFQLMPDIMRLFDVDQYRIPTVGGAAVDVLEQRHPLLAMEPSLMLVRAYSNAVGHELPGVSAYHTGPGNIFHLYQAYLRAHAANPPIGGHVSNAYMWGVTDGFERVDAQSSFGPESRAYVMKAYGALRATEGKTIDPAETFRGDLVQIAPGRSITLDRLLTALGGADRLEWDVPGDAEVASLSLYERFRRMNPHFDLPTSSGDVPPNGNLVLTETAGETPIQFFLPLGADDVLRRVGLDVIGEVFTFDENTYRVDADEITPVDRAYEQLVRDTGRFGFSMENKARLDRIATQLQTLAEQYPDSRYRQTQAKIARIHRGVWGTRAFRDLAGTVETLLTIVPERRAAELAADSARATSDG
ncbi:MAG: hypothetical protein R3181_01935 [Rubricoccaceae bacterium]|nr:hypothetical protein [Rubricoccaceae bacterium]